MEEKTFKELENTENITVEDLRATLKEYVQIKCSISSPVVKRICERLNPTKRELTSLIKVAQKGLGDSLERYDVEAAREYTVVLQYLRAKHTPAQT